VAKEAYEIENENVGAAIAKWQSSAGANVKSGNGAIENNNGNNGKWRKISWRNMSNNEIISARKRNENNGESHQHGNNGGLNGSGEKWRKQALAKHGGIAK